MDAGLPSKSPVSATYYLMTYYAAFDEIGCAQYNNRINYYNIIQISKPVCI